MSKWCLAYNIRLRELWPTNATTGMIAKEFGVSPCTVSVRANQIGLPDRKDRRAELRCLSYAKKFNMRVSLFNAMSKLDLQSTEYFVKCATERGRTLEQIIDVLLRVVACDKLIDAILDDADERKAA